MDRIPVEPEWPYPQIDRAWKWIRAHPFPRSAVAQLVELSGLCAIVYGVAVVDRAAGLIVGGLLAVLAAYALERR